MGVRYFCDLCDVELGENDGFDSIHITFIGDKVLCDRCGARLEKHIKKMWRNLREK